MSSSIQEDEVVGTKEDDLVDSVKCYGFCGRRVYEGATVDVVSGKIYDKGSSHVKVASVEGNSMPEIEKWCVNCADDEFGVSKEAGERKLEQTSTYITPSNVLAFFLGSVVMYLFTLPF